MTGFLTGRIALDTEGRVIRDALSALSGHVVLAVDDGRIARALIEKASTDIRSLFRSNQSWTPVTCLLGLVAIEGGVGQVGPLRLRAPGAGFAATGTIDFAAQSLDLTIRSDSRDSGFLALNIPLQVRGPFGDIGVTPLAGRTPPPPADARLDSFPEQARTLAGDNSCLR